MLIIDDILLAPLNGTIWIADKIKKALDEEIEAQYQRVTAELSESYMMLERGAISEEEFDDRERKLLDKLEKLEELRGG